MVKLYAQISACVKDFDERDVLNAFDAKGWALYHANVYTNEDIFSVISAGPAQKILRFEDEQSHYIILPKTSHPKNYFEVDNAMNQLIKKGDFPHLRRSKKEDFPAIVKDAEI